MDLLKQKWHLLAIGLAEIIGVLATTLVVIWIYNFQGGFAWRSNPSLEFNWHPVLMTIGMIFLNANSIMIYRAIPKTSGSKLLHFGMQAVVLLLSAVAMLAAFDFHNLHSPPITNLYTLHSWVGILATILFICQWPAALVGHVYTELEETLRVFNLPLHVYLGILAFVCSVVSALLGFVEKAPWNIITSMRWTTESALINCIGILLLAFALLMVFVVKQQRHKSPTETISDMAQQTLLSFHS